MKIRPPALLLALSLAVAPTVFADQHDKKDKDRAEMKTPFDQSERAEDVQLTASIRERVVGDDSLSANAKNVKIISSDGKVWLRGPVETAEEKAAIVAHAKSAGASDTVVDLTIGEKEQRAYEGDGQSN